MRSNRSGVKGLLGKGRTKGCQYEPEIEADRQGDDEGDLRAEGEI